MSPLERCAEPAFWKERAARCREEGISGKYALHHWQHEKVRLAEWFHTLVRSGGRPKLCAYCDGELRVTSAETIDHFIPEVAAPGGAMEWENLYPACHECNVVRKRVRWSCKLIRPDRDPVLRCFDFDPEDGSVRPAPDVDAVARARVRMSIGVFGLNTADRREARYWTWRSLVNAGRSGDLAFVRHCIDEGPYRFIARRYLLSLEDLA
jgi:uncharacterized protein (TIGR02646 family)